MNIQLIFKNCKFALTVCSLIFALSHKAQVEYKPICQLSASSHVVSLKDQNKIQNWVQICNQNLQLKSSRDSFL